MKVVYRKGWVKIQQMYENLEIDLDLKLLFMVTGAYYESGLWEGLGENTANVWKLGAWPQLEVIVYGHWGI